MPGVQHMHRATPPVWREFTGCVRPISEQYLDLKIQTYSLWLAATNTLEIRVVDGDREIAAAMLTEKNAFSPEGGQGRITNHELHTALKRTLGFLQAGGQTETAAATGAERSQSLFDQLRFRRIAQPRNDRVVRIHMA
ncbi:hypothetical protein BKA82DRAFT_4017639 [Pisolithus tinctorius]|nr:hypothetical protein BKA82DRAFT_4017639 [Pisolithus tinctorius]